MKSSTEADAAQLIGILASSSNHFLNVLYEYACTSSLLLILFLCYDE